MAQGQEFCILNGSSMLLRDGYFETWNQIWIEDREKKRIIKIKRRGALGVIFNFSREISFVLQLWKAFKTS